MINLKDFQSWSGRDWFERAPRSEAPREVRGGFNHSVTVYTVARKGKLTLIGRSNDCTFAGDPKPVTVAVPDAPRILVVDHVYGNGGFGVARLYD